MLGRVEKFSRMPDLNFAMLVISTHTLLLKSAANSLLSLLLVQNIKISSVFICNLKAASANKLFRLSKV
jgi:hypothetical protein